MTNDEVLATLQHLIGSRYVPAVKAYISELTGRTRVVGPNEPHTRELDHQRISIRAGGNEGEIESFTFG